MIDVKSPFVRLEVLIVDVILEFLLYDSLSDETLLVALVKARGSPVILLSRIKLIRSEDLVESVPVTNRLDCSADL